MSDSKLRPDGDEGAEKLRCLLDLMLTDRTRCLSEKLDLMLIDRTRCLNERAEEPRSDSDSPERTGNPIRHMPSHRTEGPTATALNRPLGPTDSDEPRHHSHLRQLERTMQQEQTCAMQEPTNANKEPTQPQNPDCYP